MVSGVYPVLSLALCYGVVTAVGLIPGLLYGNEFAYWLLGFRLILPVSALLVRSGRHTAPCRDTV